MATKTKEEPVAKTEVRNTSDLRRVLIETIDSVRSGDITPAAANAVGNLAGKVLQSAKLDLDVLKLGNDRGASSTPLIELS